MCFSCHNIVFFILLGAGIEEVYLSIVLIVSILNNSGPCCNLKLPPKTRLLPFSKNPEEAQQSHLSAIRTWNKRYADEKQWKYNKLGSAFHTDCGILLLNCFGLQDWRRSRISFASSLQGPKRNFRWFLSISFIGFRFI